MIGRNHIVSPAALFLAAAIAFGTSPALAAKGANSWSAAKVLTSSGNGDPTRGEPQEDSVGVNSAGFAVAAWDYYWYTGPYGGGSIQAAVQLPGGQWGAPATLSDTSLYSHHPRVAVGPDSTAVVVWTADATPAQSPQTRTIQASVRPAGGGWTGPITLDTGIVGGAPVPGYVVAAVDDNGQATVAWTIWDGAHNTVKTAKHAAGASWSDWTTTVLTAPGSDGYAPTLAVNARGDAVVAWSVPSSPGYNTPNEIQASSRSGSGGSWSAPASIASVPPLTTYYQDPQAVLDGQGLGTVVWRANGGIMTSRQDSSGAWSAAETLVSPAYPRSVYSPSLAVDAAGDTVLGYAVWDPSINVDRGTAYVMVRPTGGAWGAATQLTDPTLPQDVLFVRAAVSPDGTLAFVAWIDNYNSNVQVTQKGTGWAAPTWMKAQTAGKATAVGSFAQYMSMGAANGSSARILWKTQSGAVQDVSQYLP
jgi:hypothetical protein